MLAVSSTNHIGAAIRRDAEAENMARKRRVRDAWQAYYGTTPPPLAATKKPDGKPDSTDDVPVNMSRLVVDEGVSFLFGKPVTFTVPKTAGDGAQETLDAIWQANRQPQILHDLALNGAVSGHAFYKIIPATEPGAAPRVVVVDPSNVDMECDPDDVDTIVRYTITWTIVRQGEVYQRRQTITVNDVGGSWTIVDEESSADSMSWRVLDTTLWAYPWPPIGHCKNLPAPNELWGTADLEPSVTGLDQSLRFLLSNLRRIIRFHAHPKTIASGLRAKDLQTGPDGLLVLPSPESRIWNLEMQSDLASSLEVYGRVKEALHQTARVPEVAAGKVDQVGNLSGIALQILFSPLLQKTETKRVLYGHMLAEACARLLELAGVSIDQPVTVTWPELLPKDSKAEADTALALQTLGVSVSTLLERLGFDPDLEADRRMSDPSRAGADLLRAFAGADTVPNEQL